MKINIQVLENGKGLPLPEYQTAGAACVDLYAAIQDPIIIDTDQTIAIPVGFKIEIPYGFEAQIRPRSGLALKGIITPNSPGTIDSDYRGEVMVLLRNMNFFSHAVRRGDRIAQMAISRTNSFEFVKVDKISETLRGAGGFGSTGV